MKRYLILLVVGLMILWASTAVAEVKVVSTIPDFADIAKQVGGPHIATSALVKPTQDPHFVDGKPSLMLELNRSDLLLVTGMDLEAGWLPPLMTGARNSKIQRGAAGYLDCSTLVPPIQVTAVDRAAGDVHPGGNPHYWLDPRNGIRIARGIASRLAAIDPEHATDYDARAQAYVGRLQARIEQWQRALAPHKGTNVVVYHESWVYFLDWAGFNQVGSLEPKPGIPPKPAHVAQLLQTVRVHRVRLMLQESYYPTQLSRLFADRAGAELKVLPTMTGAAGTQSYFDMIDTIVREVTR